MSREIKFRLHCKGTGKILAYEEFNTTLNWGYYWYDATLLGDDQICQTSNYFRHEHPIGQVVRVEFTGLLDANGVEIYEGDLVSIHDYDDGEFLMSGVVKFGVRGYPAFDVFNKKNDTYTDEYNTFTNDDNLRLTVFGNIYQNKDALK